MQAGLVFGLIFALILMAFIFVFAADQITLMLCTGSNAQVTKNVLEFEKVARDVLAATESSTDVFDVKIPEYSKICFVNHSNPSTNQAGDWWIDPETLIDVEIMQSNYTVWVESNCGTFGQGKRIPYIEAAYSGGGPNKNFCAGPGDRLLLTSKGYSVGIDKII